MKHLHIISTKLFLLHASTCILILAGMLLNAPSIAQTPKVCGDPKINNMAMKKAENFLKTHAAQPAASATLIRVYFHICRDDDGTNEGATTSDLENEFNQLITDFRSDNICFANMGLNYIDNTQINTNLDVRNSSNVEWLTPYLVPGCINIFYHANLNAGGSAYNIPNTFCSIQKGNLGASRTTSHEIGHCLGLMHTFEDCSGSFINDFLCDITGDHVCDTEADPYCFKLSNNSCFSNSGCSYTGSCKDASLIASNWSPPYNNIMNYWWVEGCTVNTLTRGQYDRIDGFLSTDGGLLNCQSSQNDVVGPENVSSGFYVASAMNQLSTSGSFNLSGSASASFVAKTVLIEPGFHGFPSGNGIVTIRNTSCIFSLQHPIAQANSENISQLKNKFRTDKDGLEVHPNPTSAKVNLVFTLKENEKNVFVKVNNVNSQLVKELRLSNLKAGRQSIELNLSNLASGVYFVNIQLNGKRLNSKVILTK